MPIFIIVKQLLIINVNYIEAVELNGEHIYIYTNTINKHHTIEFNTEAEAAQEYARIMNELMPIRQ